MKVEFWKDDAQSDAICTFSFNGWLAAFHINGGGGSNHLLNLKLVPELDPKQFMNVKIGN